MTGSLKHVHVDSSLTVATLVFEGDTAGRAAIVTTQPVFILVTAGVLTALKPVPLWVPPQPTVCRTCGSPVDVESGRPSAADSR